VFKFWPFNIIRSPIYFIFISSNFLFNFNWI